MIHPGHPLMLAVTDLVLENNTNLMRQGAILVDPSDEGVDPSLLFLITHEVKSGNNTVLSKRLQFVKIAPDGTTSFAGWAPHLDYEALAPSERALLAPLLASDWIKVDQEQKALSFAASSLVPQHFEEISSRRIAHVDKTLAAVHERLTKEIDYWSDRWIKLTDDKAAGLDVGPNLDKFKRTINDLEGRLTSRKQELQSMRHITNGTPVVLGGALIVPVGLMKKLRGESVPETPEFSADPAARSRIEKIAMEAVIRAETARGCTVKDVSAEKCGWDITSLPPVGADGKIPMSRHIEVKGRSKGATTITVTKNEIMYALNQADKFILAIVIVDENEAIDGPHYVRKPFGRELDWDECSSNRDLAKLLSKATSE